MERGGGAVEEILTQTQNQNNRRVRVAEGPQPPPHPPPQKCPRCDSLNTKFCYYNNYSLSQPRYFCKGCRRYWTHGGTLRNVPIGGGCRKGKRPRTDDARGFTHAVPATNFSAVRAPVAIGGALYGGGGGLGFFPSAGVNENFQLGVNLPAHHHYPGQNDFYLTPQNFTFPATARPWPQSFVARNASMAGSSSTLGSGFWTGGENPGVGYSFNPNQWPGFDPSA